MAKFKDIMLKSENEKFTEYEKIGVGAKNVKVKEHRSGFPAITIIYKEKGIYLKTDVFSLEKWFGKKRAGNKKA